MKTEGKIEEKRVGRRRDKYAEGNEMYIVCEGWY